MSVEIKLEHGSHQIEQTAKVYLDYDGERWRVAGQSMDGYPLDAKERARCELADPHGVHSETAHVSELDAECIQLLGEADGAPIPTGEQLIPLLAEHLETTELVTAIGNLVALLERRTR